MGREQFAMKAMDEDRIEIRRGHLLVIPAHGAGFQLDRRVAIVETKLAIVDFDPHGNPSTLDRLPIVQLGGDRTTARKIETQGVGPLRVVAQPVDPSAKRIVPPPRYRPFAADRRRTLARSVEQLIRIKQEGMELVAKGKQPMKITPQGCLAILAVPSEASVDRNSRLAVLPGVDDRGGMTTLINGLGSETRTVRDDNVSDCPYASAAAGIVRLPGCRRQEKQQCEAAGTCTRSPGLHSARGTVTTTLPETDRSMSARMASPPRASG